MSKARRQVQENLKFVILWRFCRCLSYYQAKNPMLTKIVGDKPKLMILNKVDYRSWGQQKNGQDHFFES